MKYDRIRFMCCFIAVYLISRYALPRILRSLCWLHPINIIICIIVYGGQQETHVQNCFGVRERGRGFSRAIGAFSTGSRFRKWYRCKQVTHCMKSSRNTPQCARNRKLVRVISISHMRVYRESARKYRYYFLSPYFVLQPKATVNEFWADMCASLHTSKHVLKLAHTATQYWRFTFDLQCCANSVFRIALNNI